jgi:hypothetical protein
VVIRRGVACPNELGHSKKFGPETAMAWARFANPREVFAQRAALGHRRNDAIQPHVKGAVSATEILRRHARTAHFAFF